MKKRVVITGAAGFIGGHLSTWAKQKGHEVIAVDHPAHFKDRIEWDRAEGVRIVDRDQFLDWVKTERSVNPDFNIDVIFHLGACTDTTQMDEVYLKRVNLEYSKSIWSMASRFNCPLIYASSAATYGAGEWGYEDKHENISHLVPLNPYGESKRLFDLFVLDEVARKQPGPPKWAGFKFFNVYGPGERHKGKMASVVLHGFDQICSSNELKLFKSHKEGILDGEQKRDFIYVEDVVSVLCFAWESQLPSGIYNLGSGKARTFYDLGMALFKALQLPQKINFIPMPEALRERYQYFTEAKMDKLKQAGYLKPFTSLEDGVRNTVNWLKSKA